eukprot:5331519-Amphidinium_carterae.1
MLFPNLFQEMQLSINKAVASVGANRVYVLCQFKVFCLFLNVRLAKLLLQTAKIRPQVASALVY